MFSSAEKEMDSEEGEEDSEEEGGKGGEGGEGGEKGCVATDVLIRHKVSPVKVKSPRSCWRTKSLRYKWDNKFLVVIFNSNTIGRPC